MDEEEQGGISIGDIFRTIFSQKWLALIITVVITLVGVLGINLIYNKMTNEYVSSFKWTLSGASDSSSYYTYPDGTVFYYSDVISIDNLLAVKQSDEAFAGIDVEKMAEKGDISISYVLTEAGDSYEGNFTISIKAKYFDSEDTAREFVRILANTPSDYLSKMTIDYDVYLVYAKQARDYEGELGYISSQLSYLINHYNSLISSYGENFVVSEGKTLRTYLQQLNLYLSNNTINNLITEAREGNYLKSESLKDAYKLEVIELERSLSIAQQTLDSLLSLQGSDIESNASVIKEQSDYVGTLKQKIQDLTAYIENGEVSESFAGKIAEAYEKVTAFTGEYEEVARIVYSKASAVNFLSVRVIEQEGGIGLVLSGVISLVIGLILGCIVAYIVAVTKRNRLAAQQTSGGVLSAEGESQAQAAVTDADDSEK